MVECAEELHKDWFAGYDQQNKRKTHRIIGYRVEKNITESTFL